MIFKDSKSNIVCVKQIRQNDIEHHQEDILHGTGEMTLAAFFCLWGREVLRKNINDWMQTRKAFLFPQKKKKTLLLLLLLQLLNFMVLVTKHCLFKIAFLSLLLY